MEMKVIIRARGKQYGNQPDAWQVTCDCLEPLAREAIRLELAMFNAPRRERRKIVQRRSTEPGTLRFQANSMPDAKAVAFRLCEALKVVEEESISALKSASPKNMARLEQHLHV